MIAISRRNAAHSSGVAEIVGAGAPPLDGAAPVPGAADPGAGADPVSPAMGAAGA